MRRGLFLLAVWCGVWAGAAARAVPVASTAMSTDELAFAGDVSSSDLLHGIIGDHVNYNTAQPTDGARANDGLHGGPTDLEGIAWASDGDVTSTTFDLGPGDGFGWDLTGFTSIAAWNSAGFMNQKYDVSVRFVGEGEFSPLFSVEYQPFDANGGPGATKVEVTDSSGVLATGVEAVRFSVLDTNSNNVGGVALREFDVFGALTVPEPGPAMAVVTLLAVGLVSRCGRPPR